MTQLNAYWQQLTDEQIRAGEHRDLIGGLWEELGELQFKFLLSAGLRPDLHLAKNP